MSSRGMGDNVVQASGGNDVIDCGSVHADRSDRIVGSPGRDRIRR